MFQHTLVHQKMSLIFYIFLSSQNQNTIIRLSYIFRNVATKTQCFGLGNKWLQKCRKNVILCNLWKKNVMQFSQLNKNCIWNVNWGVDFPKTPYFH